MSLLTHYKSNLKGDLIGGLTAAIVAIPTGLAFGIASGLGPEAGLYTAVFLAIVAGVFGGTQTLISDPTGPMTLVAAGVVGGMAGGTDMAMLTFALTGIIQVLFSFLKIAKYVKFIPYPVVSGFMGGIGVIIISLQLFPLLGHGNPKDKSVLNIFSSLPDALSDVNYANFGIGILTIALIYLIPFITKKVPSILVSLLVATAASVALKLDIPTVPEISSEIPMPDISFLAGISFSDISHALVMAITLASLGTIDTLLTSVVADNLTKTKHKGDRELLGQGVGNFVVSLFGGFPGAGSTSGSVINIKSGAKTNLSGVSKGVFLLFIILFLSSFISYVPTAALAGILVTVGIGVIDIKGIKMLLKVPKGEALILILTLLVTVFDDLLHAVALGALLATVFFMEKMSKVVDDLNSKGGLESFAKKVKIPDELLEKVFVVRLDGPVFFGFADDFKQIVNSIEGYEAIIIDMKRVPFTDQTGMMTIEDTISSCKEQGIEVYIVGANNTIFEQMESLKIPGGLVDENHFFPYFKSCVKHLKHVYLKEV